MSVIRADNFVEAHRLAGSAKYQAYRGFGRHGSAVRWLNQLYQLDKFTRLIVDRPADDATRRGWTVRLTDEDRQDEMDEALRQLGLNQKLHKMHKWSRLQGGCGAVLITNDNAALDKPMGEADEVLAVHVFGREKMRPADYDRTSIESPTFGQPKLWRVSGEGVQQIVHTSRVLTFKGLEVPPDHVGDEDEKVWGQSVVEASWEALHGIEVASRAVNQATEESQYRIIKTKNLADLILAEEGELTLDRRLEAIEETKDRIRTIVLDSEEDYITHSVDFSANLNAYAVAQQDLSAVSRIPITLLFGQSPSGFSTGDETGQTNYWDGVRSMQRELYQPAIERVATIIARGMGIGDKDWSVEFASLKEPTEQEKANTRKVHAETDALNIDRGVYTPEEARSRYTGHAYQHDLSLEKNEDVSFADMEAMLNGEAPE